MSVVKFSEVAHRANTKEDRFNTDKIYYVGGEHIEPGELFIHDKGVIKGSTIGPMFYCGFKSGQILFVTRNPHLRKCSVAEFDGICSEKTFVIETIDERILLQEYLASVMLSDDFWNYCEENKSGGVNYFLNWSTLADYEFELPSVEEQKAISDKVWAAYRLKESYKKLLAATEEMVKSQFIEMFAPYPYVPLSYYVSSLIGGRSLDGGTANSNRVLKTGSVSYNYFVESEYKFLPDDYVPNEAHKVKIGDVIISRMNTPEYVGACAYVSCLSHDVYLPDRLWKVEIKENVHPIFLWQSLIQDSSRMQIKKLASGTSNSMKNISKNNLLGIFVKEVPICEQMKFVEIYKQADKSGFELRKSIDAIDAVIKSLVNS